MTRDYTEDQCNEVIALESIYGDDLKILQQKPFHKLRIRIETEEYDEETGLACQIIFTFTEKYPDEAPLVELEDPVNFEDTYAEKLEEHLKNVIEENLGMEMIFTLVSSAQEWLNERWDEFKHKEDEERERKLQEVDEAERKRFEGTRVNVETFMKWKLDFEETTGINAKRLKNNDGKKLTGRELFMQDNTLNDSDIKFLLEAGDSIENVKIDESLFQNIGDLELEEDDSDDEEWVPGDDDEDD